MPDKGRDSWSEYQKLVMSELERLDRGVYDIDEKVDTIRAEIKLLKYKSTMWGAVAGGIPAVVLVVLKMLGV